MGSDARKKYYAGISILISNAARDLDAEEFKQLGRSTMEYFYQIEKGEEYGKGTKRAKGEETSSRD